jgi:hypothetical protein
MSDVVFVANFGAEEGHEPTDARERFPGEARLREDARGLFAPGGAFDDVTGVVAWFNSEAAWAHARARGQRLWGASAAATHHMHDKGTLASWLLARGDARAVVLNAADVNVDRLERARTEVGVGAVIKPRMSTTGRGFVHAQTPITDKLVARVRNRGGCVVEPWCQRSLDLSSLWRIHPNGTLQWLGNTRTDVDAAGTYRGTHSVRTQHAWCSDTSWDNVLVERCRVILNHVAATGYFGPCGVDAFVHHGVNGQAPAQLHLCEINARFTVGMVAIAGAAARTRTRIHYRAASGFADAS